MVVFIIGLLIFICMAIYGYYSERKQWNNGISPIGEKWQYFDTDSQGGRGYSDSANNTCWISWPGIDR